ncbi:MAG: chromosomal replication initiator protein DnaA [Armatimonadota bacterium]|nr:chromosomal replication initiator protein DnaA [Armatimonadota bacterium]MDR5696741.1 chromosomal replication initiator protein DnaA [Armatimonadota bacterium]
MPQSRVQQVWQDTLSRLQERLSRPGVGVEMFLKSARPLLLEDDAILLAVPNAMAKQWVEERYLATIREELHRLLGREISVRLLVSDDGGYQDELPSDPRASLDGPRTVPPDGMHLSPRYTFDTFVVGSGNRFAHAAALAVAESPARAYNPLFIYGGVGLGKTHLLQAIAHKLVARRGEIRIFYCTGEKFTNEVISAIQGGRTEDLRRKYRSVDVLLIDDIQFIAGKPSTQEEFFHTFNALHDAGKQIILTSDRPPKDIPTLEDRLRSRFEWGLIADVQPPDYETRVAILRKKAELERMSVPHDVTEFIAQHFQSNIRELEGALVRVVAYATLTRVPPSVDLARTVLRDLLPQTRPQPITIAAIQKAVAEKFGLRLDDMKAKRRTKGVAFPRQVAMYLARELTDSSLPRIGDEFGGRDHTTVMHACDRVREQMQRDPHLAATVHALIQQFQRIG